MNLSDYGRSLIRTAVPLLVGSLVSWLATRGVNVDLGATVAVVDTLIGAVYYAAVRAAEKRWPGAGWLLGAPGAPSYGVAGGAGAAPVSVPVAGSSTDGLPPRP